MVKTSLSLSGVSRYRGVERGDIRPTQGGTAGKRPSLKNWDRCFIFVFFRLRYTGIWMICCLAEQSVKTGEPECEKATVFGYMLYNGARGQCYGVIFRDAGI